MQQVIYGDVLFAVNFSMDFLSLYVSGKITHERLRPLPLAAGAAIGAIYGTASVFLQINGVFGWIINAAVAALMCFTAYDRAKLTTLVRRTALCYGIGFLLGGAMTALYNLLSAKLGARRAVVNGQQKTLVGSVPLTALIGLGAFAAGVAIAISRVLRKRRTRGSAELEITLGRRTVKMRAICDSGNLAAEPLGGLPVIFITAEKMRELLPTDAAEAVISGDPAGLCSLPPETARRTRVVPITTVSGKRTAVAVIPDRVTVEGEVKRACVAAGDTSFGDDDAVLPEILAG